MTLRDTGKPFRDSKYFRWIPYWVAHILVSTIISLILGHWLLGPMFYAGREFTQYEEKGYFDWRGIVWPFVAALFLHILKLL